MKNILFICNAFPNLSETFIRDQIDYFVRKEYSVSILAAGLIKRNEILKEYDNVLGIDDLRKKILLFPIVFIKLFFKCPKKLFDSLNFFKYGKEALYLKLIYALYFLKDSEVDSMICHFGRSGNVGAFLKENLFPNAKLLCMFHGRDIREGISNNGKIYKPLFENVDIILSISSYNYDYLSKWEAPNIFPHPVGVDTKFFLPNKNKSTNKKEFHILTVGRLVPVKGYQYALRAIADLIEKLSDIKIIYDIVGEGEEREAIECFIRENKLEDNIFLHGARQKEYILKMYQNADVFLLPSIAEALPVVIMEASSCGLPVIATDVGSVREEIQDGESGFVVESKSSDAIMEKLRVLIEKESLRKEMGDSARQNIIQRYDINILNKRLEKMI